MDFREHLRNIFEKVNRTIHLLRKLQNNIPRAPLVTIYKFFIRPHLDYGDVLYDQTFSNSFHEKLESFQYKVAIAIAGAIRDSSREKRYQDVALKPYSNDGGTGNFVFFFKNQSPR